ncbi:MAG: hypothetical protein R6U98_06570 [Pirellulaceae bacterium]
MSLDYTSKTCSNDLPDASWIANELARMKTAYDSAQTYYSLRLEASSTGNSEDYLRVDSCKVPAASTLVAVKAICTAITADPNVTIYDEELTTPATMLDADIDIAATTNVDGVFAAGAVLERAAGDVISLRSKNGVGDDATNVSVILTFKTVVLNSSAAAFSHTAGLCSGDYPDADWLNDELADIAASYDNPLHYIILKGGHSDMDPGTGATDTDYDSVVCPVAGEVVAIYAVAGEVAVTNDLELNVKNGSDDLCSANMKFAAVNTFLTGTLDSDHTTVAEDDVLTIYANAPDDNEEAQNVSVYIVMRGEPINSSGGALAYSNPTLGSGANISDAWNDEMSAIASAYDSADGIVIMDLRQESVGAGAVATTIQDVCTVPCDCTLEKVYFIANAEAGSVDGTADLYDEELTTPATLLDAVKTIAAAKTAYKQADFATGADLARSAGDVLSLRVTTNAGDGSLTNIHAIVVAKAKVLNSTE